MGTEITRDSGLESDWGPRQTTRRSRSTGERTAGETSAKNAPAHYTETRRTEKDPVTQSLGWFSIGLGAAEVLAHPHAAQADILDVEPRHR